MSQSVSPGHINKKTLDAMISCRKCAKPRALVILQPVNRACDGHGVAVGGEEGSVSRAVVLGHHVVATIEARIFSSASVDYIRVSGLGHLVSEQSRHNLPTDHSPSECVKTARRRDGHVRS